MCAGKSLEMTVEEKKALAPGWARVATWKARGGRGKAAVEGGLSVEAAGMAAEGGGGLVMMGRGVVVGAEGAEGSWGTVIVAVVVVVVVGRGEVS